MREVTVSAMFGIWIRLLRLRYTADDTFNDAGSIQGWFGPKRLG
jgi:hypothetical protein